MQIQPVLEWKESSCHSSKTFQQAACRKGIDSQFTTVCTSLIQSCQSTVAKNTVQSMQLPWVQWRILFGVSVDNQEWEYKKSAHQMKLKEVSSKPLTLLWPLRNLLSKTHCKSQSTLFAVYGHSCLYTENVLFSSFSVMSDTVPPLVFNVLEMIIAGALFSTWITASLVSIQRQHLDPHTFLTHLQEILFQQVKFHLPCTHF